MTPAWRIRVGVGVACWVGAVAMLALAGMQPSVLAIAGLVAVAAAVVWLVLDVSDLAEPIDWRPSGQRLDVLRRTDGRQRQVHRLLEDLDRPQALAHLRTHLAGIAAERCGTARLPDELAEYLAAQPIDARLGDPQHLARVVSLIESLPGDART